MKLAGSSNCCRVVKHAATQRSLARWMESSGAAMLDDRLTPKVEVASARKVQTPFAE
jgi:hypothetical protein